MDDFGGKLRQARERRGISLRHIAARTKISADVLDALERNDISKLPGGIFSRGFVRSYAIEVGLDPAVTVREFVERFNAEPPPPAAVHAPATEDDTYFENQQRVASFVLKLVVLTLVLVGIILYFALRDRRITAANEIVQIETSAGLTPALSGSEIG